jgi:hypothetical protein
MQDFQRHLPAASGVNLTSLNASNQVLIMIVDSLMDQMLLI